MSRDRDYQGRAFHIAGVPTFDGSLGGGLGDYHPEFQPDGSFVMKEDSVEQPHAPALTEEQVLQNLAKALAATLAPPPPEVHEAAPMHSTVEGFMSALKGLPKGSPTRGRMIARHMNHGPFLTALGQHPQGKQIHSMLTQHLNGTQNAGFKPGATVATAKSESDELEDLLKATETRGNRAAETQPDPKNQKTKSIRSKEGHEMGAWNGRLITHPDHAHELDREAAIHEFGGKLPRHEAEAKSYELYRRKQMAVGAAHHLLGMKAAHALGDMQEAQRHGALYHLHVSQLGHSPVGPVPDEVKQHVERPELAGEKRYKFKQHPADAFLLHDEPAQKSEQALELPEALHQIYVFASELLKGK